MGGITLASEGGFRTGLLIGCGVALASATVAAAIPGPGSAYPNSSPTTANSPRDALTSPVADHS
ncbi:hypothetical protein HEP86_35210 [Streptomyces sp. RPA4-5]|nr:hypothetical protein HEP86_35210 [Streptomyces sp. RPA4-5]